MNDALTLQFYMAMQMFLNNPETATATLRFPSTLTASERRIVHALAVKLNLEHTSQGLGLDRFVTVSQRMFLEFVSQSGRDSEFTGCK